MVGWSSRNARNARAARQAAAKYDAWFDKLTPEQKKAEIKRKEELIRKQRPQLIIAFILAFILVFIAFPLGAMKMAQVRRQSSWDHGRVVSNNGKIICKEVEYCSPCVPIHHWHKKVFCEPIK